VGAAAAGRPRPRDRAPLASAAGVLASSRRRGSPAAAGSAWRQLQGFMRTHDPGRWWDSVTKKNREPDEQVPGLVFTYEGSARHVQGRTEHCY